MSTLQFSWPTYLFLGCRNNRKYSNAVLRLSTNQPGFHVPFIRISIYVTQKVLEAPSTVNFPAPDGKTPNFVYDVQVQIMELVNRKESPSLYQLTVGVSRVKTLRRLSSKEILYVAIHLGRLI